MPDLEQPPQPTPVKASVPIGIRVRNAAVSSPGQAFASLGHPANFERAYRDHAGAALTIAVGVLRDHAAAEDVVHEVFLTLWRKPTAFDPERGSLRSYVSMLARSRAVDAYRSRAAGQAATERAGERRKTDAQAPTDVIDAVLARERTSELLELLGAVPRQQRLAVLASAYGMTGKEVAEATQVPLGTAKSRVRLGLLNARVALEQAA